MIDVNDNKPKFLYPESSKRFAKFAYFGAVARDKEISSPVIQIKVKLLFFVLSNFYTLPFLYKTARLLVFYRLWTSTAVNSAR